VSALFPRENARRLVEVALVEDLGERGDVTSAAVVPEGCRATGRVVAREACVVAGGELVEVVMEFAAERLGGGVDVAVDVPDGQTVGPGGVIARLEGDAHPVLAGERLMLNLIARLCGIATLTAEAVSEIAGTRAHVADTRKTTPLLRALEKYAVAAGGGVNHRMTLGEQILVKDNHRSVAGGTAGVVRRLREHGIDLSDVEIEVESFDEFVVARDAGAGWILLDNMSPAEVARCASARAGETPRLEVSGGLRPGRLRPYAEAGVDRLSLGCLTHGARSMDLSLDVDLHAG
jgi:nicotinate-nucleotide pyrophosphorylase (carboxylating)